MKFGNDGSQMLFRFDFQYMYMPVKLFNLIGTKFHGFTTMDICLNT